ncbi:unnamed protein product [Rhizophagus irregularis]|nr:unnamed protein product [Rhizophagus irregularis]
MKGGPKTLNHVDGLVYYMHCKRSENEKKRTKNKNSPEVPKHRSYRCAENGNNPKTMKMKKDSPVGTDQNGNYMQITRIIKKKRPFMHFF